MTKTIYDRAIEMAERYIEETIAEMEVTEDDADREFLHWSVIHHNFLLNMIKRFVEEAEKEEAKKDEYFENLRWELNQNEE